MRAETLRILSAVVTLCTPLVSAGRFRTDRSGGVPEVPGPRKFVPPFVLAKRQRETPQSIDQMIRTWSSASCIVAERAFANAPNRSLTEEVADRHPGNPTEMFIMGIRTLFTAELAPDVVVKAKDVQVQAHRAILCARCPALAERLSKSASKDFIWLDGPPFDQRPELVRTLVEQCYDIGPSPAEAIADFAVGAYSLVADLAALEPVGGNEMCAHTLARTCASSGATAAQKPVRSSGR